MMNQLTRQTKPFVVLTPLLLIAGTGSAHGQSSRSIALGVIGSGPPTMEFISDSANVYMRVGGDQIWFGPKDGCWAGAGVQPSHQSYTEAVQRFADVAKRAKAEHDSTNAAADVRLTLTPDTQTIGGLASRRLLVMMGDSLYTEMWLARSLLPTALRDAGDRIAAAIGSSYWSDLHVLPGIGDIVAIYGIPVRMRVAHGATLQMLPPAVETPSWLAELKAACR